MENVTSLSVTKLDKSRFIKPLRLNYTQNGIEKVWDMGASHESVAIVIFNKSKKSFILVKQLRPAVLYNEVIPSDIEDLDKVNDILKDLPEDIGKKGITLELCAGIVDKAKSLSQIATEEVEEECGFKLSKPIEFVQKFRASIGTGGAKMSLFYAEVTDQDRVSSGGGVATEGEMIDVVEMTVQEVRDYLAGDDLNSPTFTLYGLMWALSNRVKDF